MHKDIKDIIVNQGVITINPIICGEAFCEPEHCTFPESRPYYLIHYVINGEGEFARGNKIYKVKKGQLFVMRPNEVAYYKADKNNPWHYCWVGFNSSIDLSQVFSDDVIDATEYEYIFTGLRESEHLESSKEIYICAKIYELVSLLSQRKIPNDICAYEYVLNAKNFIETNYSSEINVEMIAKHLNLNRSYLSTIFKRYMGKSPKQYIINYRLNKAAELIVVYNYKTKEAAEICGYPDRHNFSKIFRSRYGVSPMKYKQGELSKNSDTIIDNNLEE